MRASLVIAASVLVFALFIVLGQMGGTQTDENHCPVDGVFTSQVVVLVDPSDALNAVQQGSAMPDVLEALQDVPEGAQIAIYSVGRIGRDGSADADYRSCVPPHPDSISTVEGLWKNRRIATRRYEEDFGQPMRDILTELLSAPSDTVSPIVEAIQAAAVDAFEQGEAGTPRELIVVSDMVQHSRDLSFFRQSPDFRAFARNPDYRTMRVDMSGVQVTILHLARRGLAGQIQVAGLEDFWREYFVDQRTQDRIRWIRVEG